MPGVKNDAAVGVYEKGEHSKFIKDLTGLAVVANTRQLRTSATVLAYAFQGLTKGHSRHGLVAEIDQNDVAIRARGSFAKETLSSNKQAKGRSLTFSTMLPLKQIALLRIGSTTRFAA